MFLQQIAVLVQLQDHLLLAVSQIYYVIMAYVLIQQHITENAYIPSLTQAEIAAAVMDFLVITGRYHGPGISSKYHQPAQAAGVQLNVLHRFHCPSLQQEILLP